MQKHIFVEFNFYAAMRQITGYRSDVNAATQHCLPSECLGT